MATDQSAEQDLSTRLNPTSEERSPRGSPRDGSRTPHEAQASRDMASKIGSNTTSQNTWSSQRQMQLQDFVSKSRNRAAGNSPLRRFPSRLDDPGQVQKASVRGRHDATNAALEEATPTVVADSSGWLGRVQRQRQPPGTTSAVFRGLNRGSKSPIRRSSPMCRWDERKKPGVRGRCDLTNAGLKEAAPIIVADRSGWLERAQRPRNFYDLPESPRESPSEFALQQAELATAIEVIDWQQNQVRLYPLHEYLLCNLTDVVCLLILTHCV